jgi:hypothetical protein
MNTNFAPPSPRRRTGGALPIGFGPAGPAGAALLVTLALLAATPAAATILTFDQVRGAGAGNPVVPTVSGRDVPPDYGDRVTGAVMDVPGGQFTYGEAGEGYTPQVVTEYFSGAATPVGPAVSLWRDGYGDLGNVLIANNASNFLTVRLSADPGYQVGLLGFDLAGWPNADYVIDGIHVTGDSALLFSQTGVRVEGDAGGARHTAWSFDAGLFASDLLLTIDFSNLGASQHDNLGLDNLRFAQTPPAGPAQGGGGSGTGPHPVPEPPVLPLLALAALCAWQATRPAARHRRRQASRTSGPPRPARTIGAGTDP